MTFEVVFDLTARPEEIQPAFWFYGLFIAVGIGLLALSAARFRGWKLILGFSVVWLSFSAFMTFKDVEDAHRIRALVQSGRYSTVEGCLDSFHPGDFFGSKTIAGNERWVVNGTEFDYGQGEVRLGYHLVERRSGFVHPDTRVRVSFISGGFYRRKEIVKLAVALGACPSAPDRSSN